MSKTNYEGITIREIATITLFLSIANKKDNKQLGQMIEINQELILKIN